MSLLALFRPQPSWSRLKDRALHEAANAQFSQGTGQWEKAANWWHSAARTWARAAAVAPPDQLASSHQQAQACFRAESVAAERAADRHMWAEDLALEEAS